MKTATTTKFKKSDIGLIPEEWEILSLGEAVEIIDGDRGTNYPNGDDFSTGGYCLFLNTKNVSGDAFDFSSMQFISREKDETLRKGKLKRGDFVLTTRGTVGNLAFYDDKITFENIRINSGMVILRNNEYTDHFSSLYLYQLLKSKIAKDQLAELTTGSAQPQLPIRDLKNLKLIKPPINEQEEIAEILSSLDDKIELNRKINANLEKLAGSLFKKWFVDIGDELPEGWRVGKLSDLIDNISDRYIGNNEEDNFPYVPIDTISPKSLGLSLTAKSEDAKSSLIKFKKDDILFGAMRPYFHKVSLAPFDGLTRTTCFILRPKNKNALAFCTLLIFQEETINFANSHSEGSTIPYAKWNNSLENMPICVPPNEILSKFNDVVYPMLEMIRESFFENMNLITIRDSLLPRLMSGKIRTKTL